MTILLIMTAAAVATAAAPNAATFVGEYDGHQMEMAVGLKLEADGRFQYGLSYGALDEEAEGRWSLAADSVLLTSDPITKAKFVLVAQKQAKRGVLHITLKCPGQLSPQLFDAAVTLASGQMTGGQLTDEGLSLPVTNGDPVINVRLFFPMFELRGDPVLIDAKKGYDFSFRFEPHDLGKVDFQSTPLKIENGELILVRYGRAIRFHHILAP